MEALAAASSTCARRGGGRQRTRQSHNSVSAESRPRGCSTGEGVGAKAAAGTAGAKARAEAGKAESEGHHKSSERGPSQVIRGHDGGHQRSSRRRRSRRDAHIELGARRHVVPARPRCWDLALTMQLPDVPRHAHAPSMGQGGRGVHGRGGCTDAAAARMLRRQGRRTGRRVRTTRRARAR